MFGKFIKIFMAGLVLANFFCVNTISAYDLPKIKIDTSDKYSNDNKNTKTETPMTDKNYIFIDEYKGFKYYLDLYSIKVKKNKTDLQSWSQFIFPIGSYITPANAKSTLQKFCFDGNDFYNSTHRKNKIEEIENDEDREFLLKCFKIGYYHAFNKKIS